MTEQDAGTVPNEGSSPIRAVPAPRHRRARRERWQASRERWQARRAHWRAWRSSRPFLGGLLLILAGLELFAIPLSGVLVQGAIKLVIYIGIGGVFGVLIGALLVVAGIMTWVNATHKTFYSIMGIVLGIVSFPASNLGGLFIGMLLAIIGGSIAFAWTPVEDVASPAAVSAVADGSTQENAAPESATPENTASDMPTSDTAEPDGATPGSPAAEAALPGSGVALA